MPASNGNLTVAERQALTHGATVKYQTERMLSPLTGTVERVSGTKLVLCDESWVLPCDFCQLVSVRNPFPNRTDFAPEDQTAAMRLDKETDEETDETDEEKETEEMDTVPKVTAIASQKPQDAPQAAEPVKTAGEQTPGATGQESATKPKAKNGRRTADRDKWLWACKTIENLQADGVPRAEAVVTVSGLPEFLGLHLTVTAYAKWATRFRHEGRLGKGFMGGGNVRQAKLPEIKKRVCQNCLNLEAQVRSEQAANGDLTRMLQSERGARLRADVQTRGIPPPPLGKGTKNVVSCNWEFSTDHGDGVIKVTSEGAGHYVSLELTEPLLLNSDEFTSLAKWADEAVAVMDRAMGECEPA
jgi:hypothetical protein